MGHRPKEPIQVYPTIRPYALQVQHIVHSSTEYLHGKQAQTKLQFAFHYPQSSDSLRPLIPNYDTRGHCISKTKANPGGAPKGTQAYTIEILSEQPILYP